MVGAEDGGGSSAGEQVARFFLGVKKRRRGFSPFFNMACGSFRDGFRWVDRQRLSLLGRDRSRKIMDQMEK